MKRLGHTVVKNAFANVIRGGASAIVAIALPHFLTRAMDHDRFAAWALMLQVSAYAGYLDFGMQTAIARYLAQAIERDDKDQCNELVSTAFICLTVAGVLALTVIGFIVWQLPHLFSHIPAVLIGDMRSGVLVLAVSAALLLPMSTFTGVLIGLHRNEYPAVAIGGARLLGAFAVILVSRYTTSLMGLALCIGIPNLLGGVMQTVIARKLLPQMRLQLSRISRKMIVELARYCSVLTYLSFAMLLISGLDVTIVGYFSFSAVGVYSIAATLIAFFSGISAAVFGAFISPVAVLHERQEYSRIRLIVLNSTRINTYGNLLLFAGTIVFGASILRLWVGPAYAIRAFSILVVLMLGQTVRLTGSAYASSLVAMGEQRFAIVPGIVEAIGNLGFSLLGIMWLGPIGVAWGTLVAAGLGLSCYMLYTVKKVSVLQLSGSEFAREGIFRPTACLLPLLLCTAIAYGRTLTLQLATVWALSLALSLLIAWRKGGLLPTGLFRSTRSLKLRSDPPI